MLIKRRKENASEVKAATEAIIRYIDACREKDIEKEHRFFLEIFQHLQWSTIEVQQAIDRLTEEYNIASGRIKQGIPLPSVRALVHERNRAIDKQMKAKMRNVTPKDGNKPIS